MSRFKRVLIAAVMMLVLILSAVPVLAADGDCQHEWEYSYSDPAPTCGTSGTEFYYCWKCGDYMNKVVPATGDHEWEDWYVTKKATVFSQGKATRSCWYCGKTQSVVLKRVNPFAKFGKKTYKLAKNKKLNLRKKLKFGNGDRVIKWKSSNKKVATVTSKGVIKPKRTGKVKITAKLKSGKVATCKVKVTKPKRRSSGSSGDGKVYWVPNGSVYHCTRNCPTLSRSRVIKSGSLSSCPKGRPCKVCY